MNNVPLGRPNGRLLRGKQDEKPIQIAALQPSRGQIATRQLPLCRWCCEICCCFCTPGSRSAAISMLHKSFWRGTEGSNPSPSSGESRANLTSSRSERAAIRFRRGACQQALALWAPPKGSVVAQPGVSGACSRVPLQMMRSLATVQSGVVGRHRLPDPGPDPRSISAKERRLNKTPRRAARRGVFPLHLSVYSTTICPYIQGCGVQM
jgi:hypothetical protein